MIASPPPTATAPPSTAAPATPATPAELVAAIAELKRRMGALILAHYYQDSAVQDVADFIGDSLQLARQAAATTAEVIVFCGVHFMAETAKILNPGKQVLLPDLAAGCSLSDSCPADRFKRFVDEHPGHVVVTYVNSSAAVKALSDYCVTSSNACAVVRSIPADRKIIFAPDQFLGDWVSRETGRELVLWQGACEVHENFSQAEIVRLQDANPGCITLVHPECPLPIRALADVVGSTTQLLEAVRRGDPCGTYLVVTEPGIVHQMEKAAPQAHFLMAPAEVGGTQLGSCTHCNTCPHMRRNTLEKLYWCMRNRSPELRLDPALIERARLPIERMIASG
jgi:quinolinate synthase